MDNLEPVTESGREGQGFWAKIGGTGQASKTGDLHKIVAERWFHYASFDAQGPLPLD